MSDAEIAQTNNDTLMISRHLCLSWCWPTICLAFMATSSFRVKRMRAFFSGKLRTGAIR